MALEDRVDRLTQTLERMLDQGRFSGGTNTGGGTGPTTGTPYAAATAGITGFVNSAGRFAQGGATFATVIEDVTKVMGAFGPVGQMMGSITGAVATNLVQMNQNLMASSKFGMGFSQNLGNFTEQLALAGISQKQWVENLSTTSKMIGGSATNADTAAKAFLKSSQALMEEGAVIRARLAGIDLSEFQDQLLLSTNLLKYNAVTTDTTQALLRASVVYTTMELDNLSRITGKNRQEIQKDVQTTQQSTTMKMALLSMNAEELTQYNKSAPLMSQFGTVISNLFLETSANRGNVVTKEGNDAKAALALISPEAVGLMDRMRTEKDEGRLKELQTEFRFVMANVLNDEAKMKTLQSMATTNAAGVKEAITTITTSSTLGADKESIRLGGGTLEGFKAINAANAAKAVNERDPLKNPTAGNQVSVGLAAAEAATKTISAGLAGGAKTMLDGAGQKMLDAKLSDTYLKAFNTKELNEENLKNMLNGVIGNTSKSTAPGTNPLSPGLSEKLKINSSSTEPVHVTGTVRIDPTASQAVGSKDTFGSWFGKDWGAGGLSMLHGKEAVVPEGKMVEFINDMVAQAPGMLSGLQGSLRNSVAENNPAAGFERAMQQFTSSMNVPSTVSPANSSTAMNGAIMETKTTSDLLTSIEKLNTKMDKLITAVEDSGNANVKAVKGRGNLIA